MAVEDLLRELTSSIYDAATRDQAWTDVNAAAQRLFRANACAVGLFNFRSQNGLLCLSSGFGTEFLDAYRDRYARLDVWLRRERAHRVPCTIHVGRELVPDSELISSQFYREWLEPQGLFHRLSAVLLREEANLCYFVALRSPKEKPFGDAELDVCRMLAPHLRRAVQLHNRLAAIEWERDAALEVLNRLPTGVVLCDENGAPVVVNESGRQILAAGDGLTLRSGRLSASRQSETDALQNLIAGAARTAHGEALDPGGTLSVPRPSGLPLSVLVSPLRAPAEVGGHHRIAAAIFISDPESVIDTNEERLARLYGLTPAESRLAAKIAQGRSVEQAAAMLNITTETARSYVKRILSKTGVKRQAELVRLLLLGPAYLS